MLEFAKPSVLVVDDEEEIRAVIAAILQNDFQTFEAGNGRQALALLKEHPVDVVLTDFNMPQLGGMDLLKTLRESNENLPIIVLTGRGSRELRLKAGDLKIIDYMEKPFHAEELLQKVKSALSKKEAAEAS